MFTNNTAGAFLHSGQRSIEAMLCSSLKSASLSRNDSHVLAHRLSACAELWNGGKFLRLTFVMWSQL